MRHELGELEQQRMHFRGFFERYGSKNAFRGDPLTTLLLRDICLAETGEWIADHLWFTETKGFKAVGPLKEGDCIEFDARVTRYRKGYAGRREDADGVPVSFYKPESQDWRLSFPTKVKRNSALDSLDVAKSREAKIKLRLRQAAQEEKAQPKKRNKPPASIPIYGRNRAKTKSAPWALTPARAILRDNPGEIKLELAPSMTSANPGMLVLRAMDAISGRHEYTPSTILPRALRITGKSRFKSCAAALVYAWAQSPGRTSEEIEAAREYLRQWPKKEFQL